MIILSFLLCFLLLGCVDHPKYDPITKEGPIKVPRLRSEALQRVSISLAGATVREALQEFPYDLNVVYEGGSENCLCSVECADCTAEEYLYAIAKSASIEVSRHGSVWIFTKAEEEKKGGKSLIGGTNPDPVNSSGGCVVWIQLEGWPAKDIQSIVGGVSGGLVWVAGDTYKYRGDLQSCLDLYEVVDVMRFRMRCMYAFELIAMTWDLEHQIGLQDSLGMGFDWRNQLVKGMSVTEWSLISQVALDAKLSRSNNRSVMVVSGVMREGTPYTTTIGDSVPYVKRAVSDAGTVTDMGVDYVDIGVNVTLSVVGSSIGVVSLDISNNAVNGYKGDYPIRHNSQIRSDLYVDGEDLRYVGSFFRDNDERTLFFSRRHRSQWDVFLRVYRLDRGQYAAKKFQLW